MTTMTAQTPVTSIVVEPLHLSITQRYGSGSSS
ncbi:MAG: hypothetical protein JWM79_864, partial [Nocardioides sp.]|nr:hypothetical protein [Nocardioides sp.]